jgi:hypothetical protein
MAVVLGRRLLVAVPAGCPAELAARITAHNADVAAWQARFDRLGVTNKALLRAAQERSAPVETITAGIAVLRAETEDVFKEFQFLLASETSLRQDTFAVVFNADGSLRADQLKRAQEQLRKSGWPWRVAGRG